MILKFKAKNSYGRFRAYPNCQSSHKLAKWIDKITFTERDLNLFKEIGFVIEIEINS
jgi:hypothetical protein